MLTRHLPSLVLVCTALLLVGATLIGGGGLGDGLEAAAAWIEVLAIASIGTILAIRRPDNAVGWLLLAVGFFYGLNLFGEAFAVSSAVELGRKLSFSQITMALAGSSFGIALASIGLLFLLFPTGSLLSPRWRWAVWLVAVGVPISVFSDFVVSRSVFDIEDFLANAWSLEHAGQPVGSLTSAIFFFGLAIQLTGIVTGAIAMFIRLRRSSGAVHQQLKWVIFTFAVFALTSFGFVLNNQLDVPRWSVSILIVVSALVLPSGLAIALFRYRLYDIDRLISRTVSYGVVIGLLAAVFAAVVTLLPLVLPAQDNLAIAGSTLAIAALFNPLRRRVQVWVDRRFNRSRYNAQLVISEFTDSLQNRFEVQGLVADWVSVVAKATEPSSVSVWVKETRQATAQNRP